MSTHRREFLQAVGRFAAGGLAVGGATALAARPDATRRSISARAIGGVAMMLGGAGLIYWELFIHLGRIRILGLAAALLIGIGGGALLLVKSLAKVCARCGTEVDALELAFPPELWGAVQAYATSRGGADALLGSRTMAAEDRLRAILRCDGCPKCRTFTRVAAHQVAHEGGDVFADVAGAHAAAADEAEGAHDATAGDGVGGGEDHFCTRR